MPDVLMKFVIAFAPLFSKPVFNRVKVLVMGATDSGFEHSAAPDRNVFVFGVRLNRFRFGMSADATEFDVDNAAGIEFERVACVAQSSD